MDLKTINNRMDFIYNSNSAIRKSPVLFSPEEYLNTRGRILKISAPSKANVNTWVGRGAPLTKINSRKSRDVNGFLRGDLGEDQTLLYGAGAIAALIGWSLWSSYNQKKTEVEATKLEIESLKLQAQLDEGRRQELIGQVTVLQNQLAQLEAQKEGYRGEMEQKIDSLPPEDYIKLPGGVVEEVKGSKIPWKWLILGGLLIGGVTVWTNRKRLL